MINIKNVLFLIFLTIFLIACNTQELVSGTVPSTSIETEIEEVDSEVQGYPDVGTGTEGTSESSYPVEELTESNGVTITEPELPLVLPRSDTGLATVGGIVIDAKTRRARDESIIYLGELIHTDKELPVIRLDKQLAPFAIIEGNGEFAISNVAPGDYALVFFTPEYSFLLEDEDSGESIIVSIEEGDVIDIGLIELK